MFQYTNFNSEKWEFRSHGVKDSYCIIREKLLHFDVKKSCMLIASIEMFETHVVTLWQHWLRHNSNASQCRIFIKAILVHTCSNQHLIITREFHFIHIHIQIKYPIVIWQMDNIQFLYSMRYGNIYKLHHWNSVYLTTSHGTCKKHINFQS